MTRYLKMFVAGSLALVALWVVLLALGVSHLTYPPGQAPGYHYGPDTICPSQAVCAAQWRREVSRLSASAAYVPHYQPLPALPGHRAYRSWR